MKVLNLTHVALCDKLVNFLFFGCSYAPYQRTHCASLHLDLLKFYRNLRFSYFFSRNPCNQARSSYIEYVRSQAEPPISTSCHFETIMENLENTETCVVDSPKTQTYIKRDKNLLNQLQKWRSINQLYFCQADKGGAIVILKRDDYNNLVQKHLCDESTYSLLRHCEDKVVHEKVCQVVNQFQDHLSKDELSYFINHEYSSSHFYVLPKIHKSNIIKSEITTRNASYIQISQFPTDLSSRPIVSNINSPTSRISHFLHKLLVPILSNTIGYVRDTFHFLELIRPKPFLSQHIFVSLDVVSLYTVIPHELGLEAIDYWFSKCSNLTRNVPSTFVLKLLQLILENNTFCYQNKFYKQIQGTAMGTKMAPVYANLVMSFLEVKLFHEAQSVFNTSVVNYLKQNYFRFLDDIFIIWDTSLADISTFFSLIDTLHPAFHFTREIGVDCLNFLDVLLIRGNNNIITDIYRKPTDSHQYLHFFSNHARHIKRNVPYSLAYRIHSIVSDNSTRTVRFAELKQRLLERKYPATLIDDAIEKAKRRSVPKSSTPVKPVVFTYSTASLGFFNHNVRPLAETLLSKFCLSNERITPSTIQPPNLRFLFNRNQRFQTKKCNKPRCLTCKHMVEKTHSITINNISVEFNSSMNCRSKNVIYIITCCNCQQFYVGETCNSLNLRVNLHRQHIANSNYGQSHVSIHLRSCDRSFSIIPIFQLTELSTYYRRKLELYFIKLLKPSLNSRV